MKLESVKSQIEKTVDIKDLEGHWWKNPRERLQEAMVVRAPGLVMPDYTKTGKIGIHTHPNRFEPSLPSCGDLVYFNEHEMRTMVVATTDDKGKVTGYTFVLKNDKELKNKTKIYDQNFYVISKREQEMKKEIEIIQKQLSSLYVLPRSTQVQSQIDQLLNKWQLIGRESVKNTRDQLKSTGWRMRMVPMKGYVYKDGYFVPKPPSPPSSSGGAGIKINERQKVVIETNNVQPKEKKYPPETDSIEYFDYLKKRKAELLKSIDKTKEELLIKKEELEKSITERKKQIDQLEKEIEEAGEKKKERDRAIEDYLKGDGSSFDDNQRQRARRMNNNDQRAKNGY